MGVLSFEATLANKSHHQYHHQSLSNPILLVKGELPLEDPRRESDERLKDG